jgi:hypothetical protein
MEVNMTEIADALSRTAEASPRGPRARAIAFGIRDIGGLWPRHIVNRQDTKAPRKIRAERRVFLASWRLGALAVKSSANHELGSGQVAIGR